MTRKSGVSVYKGCNTKIQRMCTTPRTNTHILVLAKLTFFGRQKNEKCAEETPAARIQTKELEFAVLKILKNG